MDGLSAAVEHLWAASPDPGRSARRDRNADTAEAYRGRGAVHRPRVAPSDGARLVPPDVAHEQLLTGLWVFWLIHLRLESGEDSWLEYAKLNIRPR